MRIDGQPCARAFLSMPVCLPTFNRASAAPSGRRPAPPRTRLAGPSPGLGRQRKARIRNGAPRPARHGKKRHGKKTRQRPPACPQKKTHPACRRAAAQPPPRPQTRPSTCRPVFWPGGRTCPPGRAGGGASTLRRVCCVELCAPLPFVPSLPGRKNGGVCFRARSAAPLRAQQKSTIGARKHGRDAGRLSLP